MLEMLRFHTDAIQWLLVWPGVLIGAFLFVHNAVAGLREGWPHLLICLGLHPTCYRSDKSVVSKEGETAHHPLKELAFSQHPEVKEAALRFRSFEFAGVRFVPQRCASCKAALRAAKAAALRQATQRPLGA